MGNKALSFKVDDLIIRCKSDHCKAQSQVQFAQRFGLLYMLYGQMVVYC